MTEPEITHGTEPCSFCGEHPAEYRLYRNHQVEWGTDGLTAHGRHFFYIDEQVAYCSKYDEEFFTPELSLKHDQALNEQIKAKLGFDWLAATAERRARGRRREPEPPICDRCSEPMLETRTVPGDPVMWVCRNPMCGLYQEDE